MIMTMCTKEQLREHITSCVSACQGILEDKNLPPMLHHRATADLTVYEIVLAVLTAKPFMYAIADPDGEAYFDEYCVAPTVGHLEEELAFLNNGCESPDEKFLDVPVYRLPLLERLK